MPGYLNAALKQEVLPLLMPIWATLPTKPVGRCIWDAMAKSFRNDPQANALLNAHYYNGWKLPVVE